MNLVIDSGNSSAKIGIFDQHQLVEKATFGRQEDLRDFMERTSFRHLIVSSVKTDAALITSWGAKAQKRYILNADLPLPVVNRYGTPDTLGMDRLAAVCGATALFPGENCLVIDAGTCVTFDFVNRDAQYFGGSISPGLHMRFRAVHTFTARLPLVSPKQPVPLIGDSSESSILSGVVNGMLAELDGIIGRYGEKFPDLRVILCGGDAGFFENQLKASIFASPELVLIGLNRILIHNVNHP